MEIKKIAIILMLLCRLCFGLSEIEHGADVNMTADGAQLIFHNNSFLVSLAAPSGLSENTPIKLPLTDGSASQVLFTDGSNQWGWTDVNAVAGTHSILSVTHDDTTPSVVSQGSILVGDGTPKWIERVLGTTNKFLMSDGSDADWSFIDISDSTNLSVNTAHFKLTDDEIDFSDFQEENIHVWQGSFNEQIDFTITEAGGTVTGNLEKEGGGDLTMFFSDEYTVLDCTAPLCTVDLTALVGTDTAPAEAFIYILQSDKILRAASSWPAENLEHIRVAKAILQSAVTTGTDGALGNRNWNDFAFGITDPRGHGLHMAQRIRAEHAKWLSGVALTVTGSGTSTITLDTSAGEVYQLHLQAFPTIDMAGADDIHLVNLSGSEYSTSVNMVADITTLADGSTPLANNKYFNIVVWGVQNRSGETSHLLCNLPTGQYNTSLGGTTDPTKFSVHTIPSGFVGTGFLIAELTFQLTGGGTTWTLIQNKDLLGQTPTLVPGGGTTSNITIFSDSELELFDNGDATKRMNFQLSSITTGNTRTITMADRDLDLDSPTFTSSTMIGDMSADTFTHTGSTQDYIFEDRLDALAIQCQTSADNSTIELYTADGDGTDNAQIHLYAMGTPGDVNNRERLLLQQMPATSDIWTEEAGTGVTTDLRLYTEGSTGQLTLENGGDVIMSTTYQNAVGGTNHALFIDNTGLIGEDPSAARFKENIRDYDYTNVINNLRVVKYDRKDGSTIGRVGLIADEVALILPEIVSFERIPIREDIYRESIDCNVSEIVGYTQTEIPFAIDTIKLIPYMIKEIQELRKEIDELKK